MSHPMRCNGDMKQTNRIKQSGGRASGVKDAGLPQTERNSFEQFAEVSTSLVEHLPVHEFVQRTPHRLHPDEIPRFSDRVKRMADALQLTFVPAVNPLLGVIRVFPVPLLEWVYTTMAPQFKWPLLTDAQAVDDTKRAKHIELRKVERRAQEIRNLMSEADEPELVNAAAVLLASLETTANAIKADLIGAAVVDPVGAN